jgi:Phage-related minor tail protein
VAGGDNIVRILVTADDEASAGFEGVSASADEMAEQVSAAGDEYTAAMNEAAQAQARLAELQEDGSASADELAAAQDRVTETALAQVDAQIRLVEAEQAQASAQQESADATGEYSAAAARAAEANADLAGAQSRLTAATAEYKAAASEASAAAAKLAAVEADAGSDSAAYAAQLDAAAAATQRQADASAQLAAAQKDQSAAADTATTANTKAGISSDSAGESAIGLGSKVKLAGLAMAAGAAISIKMAADWQESLTQLVTGAGEPVKAMAAIKAGILSLSTGTDTSVSDLTSGLYMISSAGFHGAEGLKVLSAAAEGAKTGDAQLSDVANVLTSAMNAYHLPASAAVGVTNQLIATVASGKMHMQDLATSLSSVLPVAASAKISFAQVGGALATMTMQGMTARRASTNLANTIRALLSPSAAASSEMKTLGLNANEVSTHLGKEGLTGTLNILTEAILRNSKGGQALAAGFAGMTPAAQSLARGILSGKVSYEQATTAAEGMSVQQQALIANFAKTAGSATGLKTTFAGAMKTMVGGATGLNVALLLGGKNSAAFAANVKSVSDAARTGGSNVRGWADIQSDFNFKLGQAGRAVQAVGYSLGDALLPAATKVMGVIADFGGWLVRNKAAAYALAAVIVGTLGMVLGGKLVSSISDAVHGFRDFFIGSEEAESTVSTLASGIGSAASSIGSGIASAASSVASFVSTVVTKLAEAAVATGAWIAEHAVATAQFIAQNVAQAASATAAFIAENAATLGIVAGIALLVAGIIYLATHWKQVWGDIKTVALDAWHFLDSNLIQPLEHGVSDLVSWVRDHFKLLATILATVLLGPVGLLIAFIATHWDQFRNLTSRLITDVTGFFRRLPGDILNELRSLPGQLLSLGRDIVEGLLHGIEDAAGGLLSTVKSLAGDVSGAFKDVLGMFSPSKVFAEHGRNIVRGLTQGITGEGPSALAAVRHLGSSLSLGGAGGGYGAAGGVQRIQLEFAGGGGSGLDALLWEWIKNNVRAKGGGGPYSAQRALGRTWPAG